MRSAPSHASGALGAAALTAWAAFRRHQPAPETSARDVHLLTEGDPERDLSPAARYRAFQYVPLLEALGLRCHVRPSRPGKYFSASRGFARLAAAAPRIARLWGRVQYGRQILHRLSDFAASSGRGVVFLQRDLLTLAESRLESLLPLFNRRVVFDFDDAIFRAPSWGPPQPELDSQLAAKIEHICGIAAAVVVANPWLADWVRPHNPNVHVVPTTLCTDTFRPAEGRARNRVPVVGWIGTSGNLFYLRAIAPALRALRERREFRLRIVCNRVTEASELPDVPHELVEWSARGEVGRIQDLDVGIMPLADDDWARGKAGFKLLQYMACGVPAVYSPVGANPEVAGDAAVPATDCADWTRALDGLLADEALRDRLAAAGRRRAVERFDRRVWAPRLAAILREVAARG